ncbi:MAG: nitroreductase family protein [Mucilaginibacter sp.]
METEVNKAATETLKTIYERRAVRKYLSDAIDDELLEKVLDAGRMAPSAMNSQLWKFYILTHQDTISEFSKAIAKIAFKSTVKSSLKHPLVTIKTLLHTTPELLHIDKEDPIFHGAPVVIFITSPKNYEWAGLDVGMCAENMMLAAKSLGLDTCPVGLAKYAEQTPILHKLEIPHSEEIQLAVLIGYGNEAPEVHPRVKNNAIFIDRMECC